MERYWVSTCKEMLIKVQLIKVQYIFQNLLKIICQVWLLFHLGKGHNQYDIGNQVHS